MGRILLQNEEAARFVAPMPLDVCGAESQGQIGYLLQVAVGDVFYERGMPRVTLGVDAANPTGATHLYERVGMHVEQENVVYEKALT